MAAAALLALGGLSTQAWAGSAAGGFSVLINLTAPGVPVSPGGPGRPAIGPVQPPASNGFCTSESLSRQTQASVTVVCSTGQFVSIKPMPGKPFTGTHGGAFRYALDRGGASVPSGQEFDPFVGTGTVTSLRVLNLGDDRGLLEFLVSF